MSDVSGETLLRVQVLLSFQTAMLGMVTPALRGVTVDWSETRIEARLCYDRLVGELENELASEVEAEVCAAFPEHDVRVRAEHVESTRPLSERMLRGGWVYRRREVVDDEA